MGVVVSSTHLEAKEMICCLCGRKIECKDVFIRIRAHRLIEERSAGPPLLVNERMEDGTMEKTACFTCPVQYGAPLELVGCGDRVDV